MDDAIGAEATHGHVRKLSKKRVGSWNGVEITEDMDVCGGYRTESFGIIVRYRYDKKYRTETISIYIRYR